MKKLWVNAVPYNKEVVISALESGAEAVVLPDGKSETMREFGKIKTVEKTGDIKPNVDVVEYDTIKPFLRETILKEQQVIL